MGSLTQAAFTIFDQETETVAKQKEAVENATMAREAAADATARGNQEAGRTRIKASQLIGAQKTAYAASGVDSTVGTAADVQASTRMVSELDAKTIENNAAREAWGFRKQGSRFTGEAARIRTRGDAKIAGTLLGALGGGIGSYGKGG